MLGSHFRDWKSERDGVRPPAARLLQSSILDAPKCAAVRAEAGLKQAASMNGGIAALLSSDCGGCCVHPF